MAIVYFLYRSTRDEAPLTVRLQETNNEGKKFQFSAKSELFVLKTFWNKTRLKQRNLDATDKREISRVNKEISTIENFVLHAFREEKPNKLDKDWLKDKLYQYYNPDQDKIIHSDLVIDCIQHIIDTANTRGNASDGLGLSKRRINSYQNLIKIFKRYQGQKRYKIKDINIQFGRTFLNWMLTDQNYSESYARKKIDDLKTVCRDAAINGVGTDPQFKRIKGGKPKNDTILYLNSEELKKIENAKLISEPHQNARKWLLLGCHIGQRGNDLLKLNESNFKTIDGFEIIELVQEKTKKKVQIPILDKTREILKDGLPYTIAIQNFNNYIKEVCKMSGIDEVVKGSKITMLDSNGKEIPKDDKGNYIKKGKKRKIKGRFPKYELITSHVCRRSFCSNLYGILKTTLIMQITAHSTETMLLRYIGKPPLDYAKEIAKFHEEQKARKETKSPNKQPIMEVIKNAANQN